MTKGHGSQLSRKQEVAIIAVLAGPTLEHAARSIGVDVRTLRRWMRLPEFKKALSSAGRDDLHMASARLQKHSNSATTVLVQGMVRPLPNSQIRASRSVVELALKARDTDDHELRIADLENEVRKLTSLLTSLVTNFEPTK